MDRWENGCMNQWFMNARMDGWLTKEMVPWSGIWVHR